jgi:DNA-binding XRE family transcriptional regulator
MRPKLTLVPNCGSTLVTRRRAGRLVKRRINPKPAARDHLQLVRSALGNGVAPLLDGAPGDLQDLAQCATAPKVSDSGFGSHSGGTYSILHAVVKDAARTLGVSCPGMESMGDRIKNLRNAKGMSQPQLGKLCGVSRSAVAQWEAGGILNPKLHTFLLLCDALGTDFLYLLYGASRKPSAGFMDSVRASARMKAKHAVRASL